jgi:hypothetical protein
MYKRIYRPDHPKADVTGLVAEHILIAESCLGRSLEKGEIVHHKDFNKLNNDVKNLLIGITRKQHQQLPEYQARFIIEKGLYKEFLEFWSEQSTLDFKNRQERELEKRLVAAENKFERCKGKLENGENTNHGAI